MTTSTITVQNESGQVTSFLVDTDDPTTLARKEILDQRIRRGELAKVPTGTKSARPGTLRPVEDYQTGLTDEKGDYLKSVHGGGNDPDAHGDALGVPSGSIPIEGAIVLKGNEPVGDSHPDAAGAQVGDAPAGDVDYDAWKLPELKDEVDRRNDDGRVDELDIEAPGNKAEIVAALKADDASGAVTSR